MIMTNKKYVISGILLVLAVVLVAGCTGSSQKTVQSGNNVTIDYVGTFDNGTVFGTSNATVAQQAGIYESDYTYEPISYIAGSGEILEALDNATIGMKIGETKNVTLTPDQAYGEYNASLIIPVPMSMLLESNITPHVNDTLYYNFEPVRVDHIVENTTDLNNSSVYIDFNNQMAGKTLHFMVTIVNIQNVTATA
jgi:peptidylprolyl isomerase